MEDQKQTLGCLNQETLRYQIWFHGINWTDGICPTRAHPPSHWGSNPHNILGSHRICGSLLQLMLQSPHEGTSYEETLWDKEAYERLADTHEARLCAYRAYNGRFIEPQFKEAVQTYEQGFSYCGVVSFHQNIIVERRIKGLTLVTTWGPRSVQKGRSRSGGGWPRRRRGRTWSGHSTPTENRWRRFRSSGTSGGC